MPIELPRPPLRSGALRMRDPAERDIMPVYRACRDPAIRRYTRIPRDYDRIDAQAFVGAASGRRRDGISLELVVSDLPDGALCGVVGIVVDRHDQARAEIGYWTDPAHRGRGLAGAGLRLLARWCLNEAGFVRLDLNASVHNAASLTVARRAGFVREGTARAAWPTPEGREDMAVFSLLAHETPPEPEGRGA